MFGALRNCFILAAALCVPLSAVEPVHNESSSGDRSFATPTKEWTYQNCQAWNEKTNKAEPSAFVADIQEKPATWLDFASIGGSLHWAGTNLSFQMAKGYEDTTLKKMGIKGYSTHGNGELNGKWFQPSSLFRTSPGGREKVLMVTTEAPNRAGGGFNQFRVVMLSNRGEMVQAQLSFQGSSFLAFRVEKVCGRGFGAGPLLDGQTRQHSPGNGEAPESIGKFPSSLPGKLALKWRKMAEQMAFVDYFLREELAQVKK